MAIDPGNNDWMNLGVALAIGLLIGIERGTQQGQRTGTRGRRPAHLHYALEPVPGLILISAAVWGAWSVRALFG